jgi:hypothetical protein
MRMRLVGPMAAAILALPGCGEGSAFDNGLRAGFRESAVAGCVRASRESAGARAAPAGFDWDRLCGCAVDRYMDGKTTAQLRDTGPEDVDRAALAQCLAEIQTGGSAVASGEEGATAGNESKPAQ